MRWIGHCFCLERLSGKNNMQTRLRKKSNFSLAFISLSAKQRQGMETLYAYCKNLDDSVDEAASPQEAAQNLATWKKVLNELEAQTPKTEMARDLWFLMDSFDVKLKDLKWIYQGVEMDLTVATYKTQAELFNYCDGVASAVGLCVVQILGGNRDQYLNYALQTGRALQMTNILRDIKSDLNRGRVYLPQEDLNRFLVHNDDLKTYNAKTCALLEFEAQKIKSLYAASQAMLSPQEKKQFFAAELMRDTYEAIFKNIERKKFNVFEQKIKLTFVQKTKLFCKALLGGLV